MTSQENPIHHQPSDWNCNSHSHGKAIEAALTHGLPGKGGKKMRGTGVPGVDMPACCKTERTKFVQLLPPNVYVPGLAAVFAMKSAIFLSCSAVVLTVLHCSACLVSDFTAAGVPVIPANPGASLRG